MNVKIEKRVECVITLTQEEAGLLLECLESVPRPNKKMPNETKKTISFADVLYERIDVALEDYKYDDD
jgi:hypothetical protein